MEAECAGLFAGEPRSYKAPRRYVRLHSNVGASLLAMAIYQSILVLNVPASSRASLAPTGLCVEADAGFDAFVHR